MKSIKYTLILFFFILLFGNTSAQQVPLNNFYLLNPFTINPAATGIQANLAAYVNYRDQWSGLKGAPETMQAGFHGLLTGNMGLGFKVEQNKHGVFKQTSFDIDYSYRIAFEGHQSLAFGLLFGFQQNKLNFDEMIIGDINDPAQYSNLIDEAMIHAGLGLHYNFQDLNVHISTPLFYGKQEQKFVQTIFGLVSYDFFLSEKIWKIQPSVLYRYTEKNISQFDVGVLTEWDRKIWLSASYRTNNSIIAGLGIIIKNLGIGYAYDYNLSDLAMLAQGSHEIMLFFNSPYSITKKKPLYNSMKRRNAWN